MEQMVRLMAVDADTKEPLYNIGEDGEPTFDDERLPLSKALEYQRVAYGYQERVESGWLNDFIIY